MGNNISTVGTIFRDVDSMGNSSNYRPEYIEISTRSNDTMRYFTFGNLVHYILSFFHDDLLSPFKAVFKRNIEPYKNMATAKMTWLFITNLLGLPSVFLTVFSDFFNIHMQEPYKGWVALVGIAYMVVMVIRASLKAWDQKISNDERSWELRRKKEEYLNGNGKVKEVIKKQPNDNSKK